MLHIFNQTFFNRELLEVSSQIQYIYTTTKICIPRNKNICIDAEDLWNFTYVQYGDVFKRLYRTKKGDISLLDTNLVIDNLKCYSGEPQLEKLMEKGVKILSVNFFLINQNNLSSFWIFVFTLSQ